MTIAITALSAFSLLLLVALLSTMREVVIVREELAVIQADRISDSSAPLLGLPLPTSLRDASCLGQLGRSYDTEFHHDTAAPHILIALGHRCSGCERLSRDLIGALAREELTPDQVSVVTDKAEPNSSVGQLIEHGVKVCEDRTGDLMAELKIVVTPSLFALSGLNQIVSDYKQGGSMTWILDRLNMDPAVQRGIRQL